MGKPRAHKREIVLGHSIRYPYYGIIIIASEVHVIEWIE